MRNHYNNKKVFVTGHTGFKGSWLTLWMQSLGAETAGYSLPIEKESHFSNLNLNCKNYYGDIRDEKKLNKAIGEFRPDIIFHLAAQPLVINSYTDPVNTYEVNVLGSLKLYSLALKNKVKAVVSVTTDKVYENKEWCWGYRENDRLGGYDPYSSSKACVEILTESFRRSFLSNGEMFMATARAGNVIGGGDWANDRLVPDLVKNTSLGLVTKIRNPEAVRPWQFVMEPLHGYMLLGARLLNEEKKFCTSFNFGPKGEEKMRVLDVVKKMQDNWNDIKYEVQESTGGRHEAHLLSLDSAKSINMLGWRQIWEWDKAISQTINWYKAFYLERSILTEKDIRLFEFDIANKVK